MSDLMRDCECSRDWKFSEDFPLKKHSQSRNSRGEAVCWVIWASENVLNFPLNFLLMILRKLKTCVQLCFIFSTIIIMQWFVESWGHKQTVTELCPSGRRSFKRGNPWELMHTHMGKIAVTSLPGVYGEDTAFQNQIRRRVPSLSDANHWVNIQNIQPDGDYENTM